MKTFTISALTLSSLLFFAIPAFADFIGPYDVSNWTPTLDGGSIDLSGAPSSVTMVSSDIGNGATNQDFTIAAVADGLVSFDWSFSTTDVDGSYYDPFGYLLNGVFAQLTDDNGLDTQSATASFSVLAGNVFGFRAYSVDSIYGSGTTIISNFSAPGNNTLDNTVTNPEPSTILLLGTGLVGLIGYRMRKQA